MGIGAADGATDGLALVAAEIVEDDEIAGPECRDEKLFDPGSEAVAVDRTIEDTVRAQAVGAQAGKERHGAPAAVGVHTPLGAGPSPTSRVGRHAPGLAITRRPARHTGNTDTETRRHRPDRLARQKGLDDTRAKINGIGTRHQAGLLLR